MKILLGILLIVLGLLILFAALIAIIDPVGTKLSDDGDPFGEPASRVESAILGGFGLALVATGSWLGFSWYRRRHTSDRRYLNR